MLGGARVCARFADVQAVFRRRDPDVRLVRRRQGCADVPLMLRWGWRRGSGMIRTSFARNTAF